MSSLELQKKIVDVYRIACDGETGALGHPRVWLQIPEDIGFVECPYCDCRYIHVSQVEQNA